MRTRRKTIPRAMAMEMRMTTPTERWSVQSEARVSQARRQERRQLTSSREAEIGDGVEELGDDASSSSRGGGDEVGVPSLAIVESAGDARVVDAEVSRDEEHAVGLDNVVGRVTAGDGDENELLDSRASAESSAVDVGPSGSVVVEKVRLAGGRSSSDENLVLVVAVARDGRGGARNVGAVADGGPGRVLEVPFGEVGRLAGEGEVSSGDEVLRVGLCEARNG
jgi:hypothetical protein